jgi:pimeloyl-ACP methyl ester carboxylesterase/DNA-binding CsgD family transcriptional regulator
MTHHADDVPGPVYDVALEPTIRQARTTDGVSIAWTSVGAGPPLILMPGVPFSNIAAEWRIPLLRGAYERLAQDVRLIQYDGRGSGHSQRDVDDFSLDAMVRDLDSVVTAAGLVRYTLLGFYHSCTAAIAEAARHPERVKGLLLFGGAARGWTAMSGPGIQALLSLIDRDWDTFADSIAHAWLGWEAGAEGELAAEGFRTATTPAVARATMEAASEVDVSAEAETVQCPALVLHRAGATVIPLEASAELVGLLPNGRLQVFDGSSATLFFEGTDEVIDTIVRFVTGRGGSSAAAPAATAGEGSALTPRERDVLRLVAAGETNAEIGRRLGVTINTVERHVANLYRKIDARGRADATAYAIRNGLA